MAKVLIITHDFFKSIKSCDRHYNIIVLGDSHAFGQGVNDGEEYAAIMAAQLERHYAVTNLAVGGWGLTQQIRRYYEFGQLYHPQIVVLQFCINDLQENLSSRVTVVEDGKFRFFDVADTIHGIKKYLSTSFIQGSHLYNLVRDSVYTFFLEQHLQGEIGDISTSHGDFKREMERIYNELLALIVHDLNNKGVHVIMISVNHQLDDVPLVRDQIYTFAKQGLISYLDVIEWLDKAPADYMSPEGHEWGKEAHHVIGTQLSSFIRKHHSIN